MPLPGPALGLLTRPHNIRATRHHHARLLLLIHAWLLLIQLLLRIHPSADGRPGDDGGPGLPDVAVVDVDVTVDWRLAQQLIQGRVAHCLKINEVFKREVFIKKKRKKRVTFKTNFFLKCNINR